MKFLKFFFLVLFSLVVLVAGGAYMLFTHYKKEMTAELISTLRDNYGVSLETSDIKVSMFSNWPQVSVQFRNVKARSDKFRDSEFSAARLSLSFNIRELLNKRFIVQSLAVRDGDIRFIKHGDKMPKVRSIQQQAQEPSETIHFEIRRIHLRNTHFRYYSPAQGQDIDLTFVDNVIKLRDFTDGLEAKLKGKVFVAGMIFREKRGEFLHNTPVVLDLHMNYFSEGKSLCVRPGSTAKIGGAKYELASIVSLGEDKRIALLVNTVKVKMDDVRRLMNPRIRRVLQGYDVLGPLQARVLLVASMGRREEPIIIIRATTEHNKVYIGTSKIPYTSLAFSGKIVCIDRTGKRGDLERATVTFDRVSGKIYDFPFTARIKVKNLQRPYISINGKMNIDATRINTSLKNDFELNGRANAHIRYSGLAEHINKDEFLGKGMKLNADLRLLNFSYREKKRPYVYTLNGLAKVRNTDLSFEDLQLNTIVAKAVLKGTVDNFVNFVLGFSKGFKARLTAHTDSFNLNPVLLQEKKIADKLTLLPADSLAMQAAADSIASEGPNALVAKKDNFSSFDFDVNLYAKKMCLRRVYAEDASISMNYRDEVFNISSLKLHTCDGRITATGVISNFNKVKADISVEDVDVNMMFVQFENFGQETIQSENLKGKIYLDATFSSHLDDQLEVIGETMSGEVRLSLKDGQLVNFEPVQKLANFLFKNRDFNNVTFSELNETFQVRGYEMKIDELEIGSNILNLYVVNGIYNFKGQSNINVLVPWNNLKKRDRDYVPKTTGESAGNTKGVKINFSGPSKKMRISLGHKELASLKPSI